MKLPPSAPIESPPWAPEAVQTVFPGPSAGRSKAVAEVFRAFSRSESLSASEARPAILFLMCLQGFNKVEDDCWSFFADCFTWFRDKRAVFAEASDDEALRLVVNRFKAHMGDKQRAELPQIEISEKIVPAVWGGEASLTAKELKAMLDPLAPRPALRRRGGVARAELAADLKEIKKEFGWLKRLRKKHPELYEYHLQRLVMAEQDRDPERRQDYLRALGRLQDVLRKIRLPKTISK